MSRSFFLKNIPIWLGLWLAWAGHSAQAQYSRTNIHSHNDYAQTRPLLGALEVGCGSIEADVYLQNGELMVAHFPNEIKAERSLRRLYLDPLQGQATTLYPLQLLIDLKTPATPTLDTLVAQLSRYPDLVGKGKPLSVVVSGNMPPPAQFGKYPDWIRFDGRFTQEYTNEQIGRVGLFSTSCWEITRWDGKNELNAEQIEKLKSLIERAHQAGKKIRFWATPDTELAWQTLIRLNVDWIGTDHPQKLGAFLQNR